MSTITATLPAVPATSTPPAPGETPDGDLFAGALNAQVHADQGNAGTNANKTTGDTSKKATKDTGSPAKATPADARAAAGDVTSTLAALVMGTAAQPAAAPAITAEPSTSEAASSAPSPALAASMAQGASAAVSGTGPATATAPAFTTAPGAHALAAAVGPASSTIAPQGPTRTSTDPTAPADAKTTTVAVPETVASLAGTGDKPASERHGNDNAPAAKRPTQPGSAADGVPLVATTPTTSSGTHPTVTAAGNPPTPDTLTVAPSVSAATAPVQAPAQVNAPAPLVPATTPAPVPDVPVATQLGPHIAALRALPTGEHVLSVQLSPESLGPVRVVAHINGTDMRIDLVGGTEQAKDALRAALGDLRRDLAATGTTATLNLAADTSSSGTNQQNRANQGTHASAGMVDDSNGKRGTASAGPHTPTGVDSSISRPSDGRIDLYV